MVSEIFLGERGLRAGWRLLIFVAVLIACLLGFREVVVHIPTVNRMVQPLREGRLVVSAALVAEFQFVLSLLVAVSVMSRIEGRSLADYGLPVRDALGRYFWQGVAWGMLAVSCVVMLIFAVGGFSFGSSALRGRSLVAYGIGWAIVFLMVGFFDGRCGRPGGQRDDGCRTRTDVHLLRSASARVPPQTQIKRAFSPANAMGTSALRPDAAAHPRGSLRTMQKSGVVLRQGSRTGNVFT